jgi:uncharacterized protein (DUF58 family)
MSTQSFSVREAVTAEALAHISSMYLRARVMVEGHFSGQHRSRMRGASVEFADHREYTPGDDTRHLDWRLYARSERHFVKEFDAETSLSVYILLDISRSMAYPKHGTAKLLYGSYLAAGLAYLAWRQRDAPGLGLVDVELREMVPPRTQRAHLNRLLEILDSVVPGGGTNLLAGLNQATTTMTRRGLVVLISDLWADPDAVVGGLRFLRRRGHDVVVLHTLHPDELVFPFRGSWAFIEPETHAHVPADASDVRRAYRQALATHLTALRQGLRAHDIDYELCDVTRPFDMALAAVIARRSRLH